MIDDSKIKLVGWEVTEDYQEIDRMDDLKRYSIYRVDVDVEYEGKKYNLEYVDEYEDQNGGAGATLKTKVKDTELEEALVYFVEELGADGEFDE